MQTNYALALAVLGIGTGSSAMQILHARIKPPVYI